MSTVPIRKIIIKTPPAGDVKMYDVTKIKAFLHLTDSSEDDLIDLVGQVAWKSVEAYTGLTLATQTVVQVMEGFPTDFSRHWWDGVVEMSRRAFDCGSLELLPRPVRDNSVIITTYDDTDTGTVYPSTEYHVQNVNQNAHPAVIMLKRGASWPLALRSYQPIEIQMDVGYGTTFDSLPADIRHAITLLAAYLFDHRGECDCAEAAIPNTLAGSILSKYKALFLR
jgi:uncharacterized phiE125 gp8 family phage protein